MDYATMLKRIIYIRVIQEAISFSDIKFFQTSAISVTDTTSPDSTQVVST
jgi:hypothetical protein